MTENKRYTTDNGSNEDVCLVDNVTGKEFESDFDEIVDLLNEQEETINNLKKALWESKMSYIEEKNEYSIDVERDIDWLKKEFEREYWNGDVE